MAVVVVVAAAAAAALGSTLMTLDTPEPTLDTLRRDPGALRCSRDTLRQKGRDKGSGLDYKTFRNTRTQLTELS